MNCCWIWILLLFCNGGFGNCGCDCGREQRDNCRCVSDKDNCRCVSDKDDCNCRSGSMPKAWNNDGCGCDNITSPARNDFPGLGRNETCGCEKSQQ